MVSRRNLNRRNNRNPPRGRMLARTRNGVAQRGNGISRQDNVNHVRKFQMYDTLYYQNASSDYSYGLTNVNISGSQHPLTDLLSSYSNLYEQYRIRKMTVRAQVGVGYTNDRRITTLVGCRVDVDKQLTAATVDNVQAINASENTVIKTFTEKGNVTLATFRPQCRVNSTFSSPILPNKLQYYPIGDASTHIWKGATVTAMIPDTSLIFPDQLGITLMTEVVVEFRGRITNPAIFTGLNTINQSGPVATYDIQESQDDLRTGLLTGAYFPISGFSNINIGNIGFTVTPGQIIGAVFRVQSTMKKYVIEMYKSDNSDYGANQELVQIISSPN